jgi:hypothetical protein
VNDEEGHPSCGVRLFAGPRWDPFMMEAHWRSAVHPDRVEGIGAFNDGRDPNFSDPDY